MRMGHVGDAASPNMLDSLNHAEANPPLPSRKDGSLNCAVVSERIGTSSRKMAKWMNEGD